MVHMLQLDVEGASDHRSRRITEQTAVKMPLVVRRRFLVLFNPRMKRKTVSS